MSGIQPSERCTLTAELPFVHRNLLISLRDRLLGVLQQQALERASDS
jgi:hypothetical protein